MNGALPPAGRMLPDGRRLHLQHGPIDLIIEAFGANWQLALQKAETRFQTILSELVSELQLLRMPCEFDRKFNGSTAGRMQQAVQNFLPEFITPMAAVAGSVADEILSCMKEVDDIERIYVNNGGDTAIFLGRGQDMRAAIAAPFEARIEISSHDHIGGIATSGWGGRSHSLGIADSVSILAENCALADAAATLIANAIDLPDSKKVTREPANTLFPDSDLTDQLVTTGVEELSDQEIETALARGQELAQEYLDQNLIKAAFMILQQQHSSVGAIKLSQSQTGVHAIA